MATTIPKTLAEQAKRVAELQQQLRDAKQALKQEVESALPQVWSSTVLKTYDEDVQKHEKRVLELELVGRVKSVILSTAKK